MNKLFIVMLAVCLVSVHSAYVKREAPAKPESNYLEQIQAQIKELSAQVNSKVQEALDPEKVKQGFNQLVDELEKVKSQLPSFAPASKS